MIKGQLQLVWRTVKEVRIDSLGNNIFMFKFMDKRRIMLGGPWHFNRVSIVLTELKGIGEITR